MRGLSSKESDYSDMNIPLTAAEDNYGFEQGSNSSLHSHSRYPPDSPSYSSPLASGNQPRSNSNKVHQPPSAWSSFLSMFTGQSSANQDGIRIIYLNNPERNSQSKYLHNRISTSKYNYFTFLPKFLYEQFSKYANIFFLFTACIQVILIMLFNQPFCPFCF
jgi:phospholipid-transporting ATPase